MRQLWIVKFWEWGIILRAKLVGHKIKGANSDQNARVACLIAYNLFGKMENMKLWPSTLEHCVCGFIGAIFVSFIAAAIETNTGLGLFLPALFVVLYFAVLSIVRAVQSFDRFVSAVLRFLGF